MVLHRNNFEALNVIVKFCTLSNDNIGLRCEEKAYTVRDSKIVVEFNCSLNMYQEKHKLDSLNDSLEGIPFLNEGL